MKKMLLNASEPSSLSNNFKDSIHGGGMLKKLKAEFSQALTDMGRDPNLQILTNSEFKSQILDKFYSILLSEEER